MSDEFFMRRAIELAERGAGAVAPNPLVGAVVVREGRVIGEGWHRRFGEAHAERNALAACTEDPAGATMYVTLEPCCHFGHQPPCVEAIIAARLRRVVIGCGDPNPKVAGGGVRRLREAGVEVTENVLADECRAQNRVFMHYITRHTPYVTLKYAMTLDGKIAAYTGSSKWITGAAAREHVQRQRALNQAIMVGRGTVQADDPQLTCRLPGAPSPLRIICDSGLNTSPEANVVRTAREVPTLFATCCNDTAKIARLEQAGCRVWQITPGADGRPDPAELMRRLAAEGIASLILEGGAELAWSLLAAGLVQRVQAYIAPLLLGGAAAKGPLGGQGFAAPAAGVRLQNLVWQRLGEDILLEADVAKEAGDVHRDN